MDTSEPSSSFELPCRHLRSKEMFYQASEDDEFASGLYWCTRTEEVFGPDGQAAGKKQCCVGRSCFVS